MEKKGGGGQCIKYIFDLLHTSSIPNKHMMTINFDTITNNYEVIYVIKTVMKYHLKKNRYEFSSVFHMVHLFADVINDAIWFMNIRSITHDFWLWH